MAAFESNLSITNSKLQRLEGRECMRKPEEERQSSCHRDEFQSMNLKSSEAWKTGLFSIITSALFHVDLINTRVVSIYLLFSSVFA